jgi:broad specificity phosphatase PhoE
MGVVLLIRHGQASFGSENYDQLSDLGQEQARVLGHALRPRVPRLGNVVAGSMHRHRQTAELCLREMGASAQVMVDASFDEFDRDEIIARLDPRFADKGALAAELSGAAEPRRAFQDLFARAMQRWVAGQHDDYTESWDAFRSRCSEGFARVAASTGRDETSLVFTSGGPIAVVMSALIGIPRDRAFELSFRLVNAGVSKVLVGRRGWSFGSLNEHGHFEHEGRRLVTHG